MFDYTKFVKTWEQSDYSKKLQRESTEKYKQKAIENEKLMKIRLQEEEKDTEEFIKPFLNHPLTSKMFEQIKSISPSKRMKSDPVYILDKQLIIVAVVPSKNRIGYWLMNNGYRKKLLGRTTIFEYIRNQMMYDNKFYFVPSKDYEKFMEQI